MSDLSEAYGAPAASRENFVISARHGAAACAATSLEVLVTTLTCQGGSPLPTLRVLALHPCRLCLLYSSTVGPLSPAAVCLSTFRYALPANSENRRYLFHARHYAAHLGHYHRLSSCPCVGDSCCWSGELQLGCLARFGIGSPARRAQRIHLLRFDTTLDIGASAGRVAMFGEPTLLVTR